ncbi:permease [Roseospira navarrensis]|uniref:Permease n=1 Tax=Roseospira navarrensis TaxID=140058 RepID=A0A7X1ZIB9_9PROT|nr:permease [Roseospira navarrensis]MQX38131.1 permease [Roseospira navarrensis]
MKATTLLATRATGALSARRTVPVLIAFVVAGALCLWPAQTVAAVIHAVGSLVSVAPLVVPGLVLSAWITASGAAGRVSRMLLGRGGRTIVVAAAIGAVTPVCGVTVLPLMAGLLAAGVPLAPVMAFWLSSPVTDPGMLAATAATLGPGFAIGKTVAAFGLGLLGGFGTHALAGQAWTANPLRSGMRWKHPTPPGDCGCEGDAGVLWAVWRDPARRSRFVRETAAMARLVTVCLLPAFAAEHALGAVLTPDAFASTLGGSSAWAVPLAVVVGAPAYIDGYAALPLTRALLDHGLSEGAALAFLVSGGVVSIWGALAILPVLRLRPFLLYLGFALAGSLASGWVYGWVGAGP